LSDWIQIAFVSKGWPSPSPVVALNYFSDCWEGILLDAIPKMPTSNPASSLAGFVTEYLNAVRDPRCVELRNLEMEFQGTTDAHDWPADHPIWNKVDALVDVDRWVIMSSTGERPIAGAENQKRFDPERFDRWPRRVAWLVSLFQRRRPPTA